jgi:hypothetical protein
MQAPVAHVMAWLGPAIGPNAFEVGFDVVEAFADTPGFEAAFRPVSDGKWLADLFTLARARLQAIGLVHIYGGGLCTFSDPARFFSHRRDRVTGRQAAFIWVQSQAR